MLIRLVFETLARHPDMSRIHTVRHHNSVFHDLLKRVPWAAFERLVQAHGADHRVRRLPTKNQFIALLYGQLAGTASLRDLVDSLHSHAGRLYHAGGRPVSRSTLADANRIRPCAVFGELFALMVAQAHRGLRRSLGEATYLIDSTSLRLSGVGTEWARFSTQACGAKVHVIYDPDAGLPLYAAVSAAKVNDITQAQAMPIVPGATYVFDLGYYDYAWWAQMDQAGCRLVTRFKANTPLTVTAEQAVPEGAGAILSDRIGLLPQRQAKSRRNPFRDPVREIRVKIGTGKVLRILSNDLDAGAQEIADLYQRRWAIELFFRWVKQTLKIRHLLGTSENAVRIQIAVALIAFLLLRMAQAAHKQPLTPLAFARLVRSNLMHRRRIDRLIDNRPRPPLHNEQLDLKWA